MLTRFIRLQLLLFTVLTMIRTTISSAALAILMRQSIN